MDPRPLEEGPKPGDFSWMASAFDRDMLHDGYRAVEQVPSAWEWLRTESPPADKGYMFWGHPMLSAISKKMEIGHSGASFAITMRALQNIATLGWDKWVSTH